MCVLCKVFHQRSLYKYQLFVIYEVFVNISFLHFVLISVLNKTVNVVSKLAYILVSFYVWICDR